jgi:RNase P subunit RPR2
MAHTVKEEHIDDICARCRMPHGGNIVLERHNNRDYDVIICQNCGYEMIEPSKERAFTDRWEMMHRV